MFASDEALILSFGHQHGIARKAVLANNRLKQEISELIRAEDYLRTSEIRYRRLFETSCDGILLVDPLSGEITDANPVITQLSGYTKSEIIGRQLWGIGLFASRTANLQMLGKLRRTSENQDEQLPLKHRDGHLLTVQLVATHYRENEIYVIQCNIRDITERMSAETAQRRIDVLSASNAKLKNEIVQRLAAEHDLQQSQQEQIHTLEKFRKQKGLLRDISRRILGSQEEERKRISRELHDVISQNLIGINVSMAALTKGDPTAFPENFRRKIRETQRIVEETVDRIHLFTRELRPAALDDLGLIPALHVLLAGFMEETGIRSSLTAFAGIEESEGEMLTALYRVAQEALANVARHANASQVGVSITINGGRIQMEIQDNGQGFKGNGKSSATKKNRLGLLGMKERIEMVGGCFQIESRPGVGTTVRAVFSHPNP